MRICTLVWHYNIEFIKITSVLTFKFQGLDCHIIVFTEPFQNKQSNPCSIWFPTLFKIAQNLKKNSSMWQESKEHCNDLSKDKKVFMCSKSYFMESLIDICK